MAGGSDKVLGFDYGLARIGVAVGDVDTRIVQPLTTLACKKGSPEWRRIEALLQTWLPCRVVVGKPGGHSPPQLLHALNRFVSGLRRRFNGPVETADEAWTSDDAYRLLKQRRSAGDGGKIRKEEIDKTAAALILEGWLANGGGGADVHEENNR